MFSLRSGTEYDFVITTITGTLFQIEVALERLSIAFGKSFREVPSTQNQMTLICLSS